MTTCKCTHDSEEHNCLSGRMTCEVKNCSCKRFEPAATEGTQEEWYCFSCNKTVPESHITYPFDPGGKMGGCKIAVPPAEPVTTGTQEGQAMNLPQTGGVYIGLHEHQNVAPAEPSTPRCKCGHMFLAHLTTGPCDFIGLLMPSHEWGKCPCTAFNPATPQTTRPAWLDSPLAPTDDDLERYRVTSAAKYTPQTTELPPLPKPLSLSKHWDGGIEWRIAGERAARLEREDQLSAALTECAEMKRQRDILLNSDRNKSITRLTEERDAEIERLKVQVGGRNIYIKSFQDSEEARMEELAALRTSRDALQVSHDRLLKSLKMNYKWVSTRELTSHKPTEDVITAAEKLTGRKG